MSNLLFTRFHPFCFLFWLLIGKVFVLMFDAKQMLPVIPGGDHIDIVKACLFSSPYWPRFKRNILIINMRLLRVDDPIEQEEQTRYDKMICGIGENRAVDGILMEIEPLEYDDVFTVSPTEKRFVLTVVPKENMFVVPAEMKPGELDFDSEDPVPDPRIAAIKWLHPEGYSPAHAAKFVVLATTNKSVDEWNDFIGLTNPNHQHAPLLSKDTFTDVDDVHGHLASMIRDGVLEKYNSNDVPPHKLILKVGDVCLVMRNLNVSDGITNNTRVVVLHITNTFIRCQTLGDDPVHVILPRIRFNFRLPYGQSFVMTRLQFPLRRAFALSINKSQGQTVGGALIDARSGFFAHGQQYVGVSRVTHYRSLGLYLTQNQVWCNTCPSARPIPMHGKPVLSNIVYPEAIREIRELTREYERSLGLDGALGGLGRDDGDHAGGAASASSSSSSNRRRRVNSIEDQENHDY